MLKKSQSNLLKLKNLLDIFASSGKPFVLSSDAHRAEDLLYGLEKAEQELKKLGYKTVKCLKEVISKG